MLSIGISDVLLTIFIEYRAFSIHDEDDEMPFSIFENEDLKMRIENEDTDQFVLLSI